MALDEGKNTRSASAARLAETVFEEAKAGRYAADAKLILARALMGQGKLNDARKPLEQVLADGKTSHNAQLELAGSILWAEVQSASGKPADLIEASERLNRLLAEANTAAFRELALEASLALGEIEVRTGKLPTGRARLEALKKQSDVDGVLLISLKASAALQSVHRAAN
jgi:hypothetical protein